MTSIDIVIPTFNETNRLVRAVISATRQNPRPRKIFVLDDGSDREVIDFLKTELSEFSNVELVLLPHCGNPGELRKRGVLLSTASWVAFLDADDTWTPDKLATQLAAAEGLQIDFVCSNATIKHPLDSPRPLVLGRNRRQVIDASNLLLSNFVVTSSVLVKRELLIKCGAFADGLNVLGVEDFATWLRVLSRSKGLYLPDSLVEYTYAESSFSRRPGIKTSTNALRDFLDWAKDPDSNLILNSLQLFIVRLFTLYLELRKSARLMFTPDGKAPAVGK